MNWISKVMYALLLTNITGSALAAAWLLFYFIFRKKLDIRIIYKCLKGVMMGFLIPVFFIVRTVHINYKDGSMGYLMMTTEGIQCILFVMFLIWFMGLMFFIIMNVPNILKLRRICKDTIPASKDKRNLVEDLKSNIGLKQTIQIRNGYSIGVPFVSGIYRPTIYLPLRQFSNENLHVILLHELCHCRQRDTFWKPAFTIICYIYWFNPLIWYVRGRMRKLAEASCDRYCCDGSYRAKDYFSSLLQMNEQTNQYISGFVPMWFENENELKWRIQCMKWMPLKKPGHISTIIILCGLVMMEGASVYASAIGAESVNAWIYHKTVVSVVEPEQPEIVYEEYTASINLFAGRETKHEPEGEHTKTDLKRIEWQMPSEAVSVSEAFFVSGKEDIYFAVALEPEDVYVTAGIIESDGEIRYIRCNGNVAYTFKGNQSGNYRIFLWNTGKEMVEAAGFYKKQE